MVFLLSDTSLCWSELEHTWNLLRTKHYYNTLQNTIFNNIHYSKCEKENKNRCDWENICFNNRGCFLQYIPEPTCSPMSPHSAAQDRDYWCCYDSDSQISPWTAVWDEEIQKERGERESERDGVGRGRVVSMEVKLYRTSALLWTLISLLKNISIPFQGQLFSIYVTLQKSEIFCPEMMQKNWSMLLLLLG